MSHEVIIIEEGEAGSAGEYGDTTARGRIEWKPPHDITGAEEGKRREKAEKLLHKALQALYGLPYEHEEDDD